MSNNTATTTTTIDPKPSLGENGVNDNDDNDNNTNESDNGSPPSASASSLDSSSSPSSQQHQNLFQPRRIDVPGDEQASSFGEGFDDKRLWVGNLDPKITEFAMLKIAEKFGTIRKLDFIYHKGGPDKGLSKGYCFISFHTWEAAEQARLRLDSKQIKGRPMYVKWAHGSKFDEMEELPKKKETPSKAKSVDTALAAASLPTAHNLTEASPQSKIQAIEAKLKLMESTKKEFGIHQSIQANPGYNPQSMMQHSHHHKADSGSGRRGGGSRSGPYNYNYGNSGGRRTGGGNRSRR